MKAKYEIGQKVFAGTELSKRNKTLCYIESVEFYESPFSADNSEWIYTVRECGSGYRYNYSEIQLLAHD